jgi:hypothetical protein
VARGGRGATVVALAPSDDRPTFLVHHRGRILVTAAIVAVSATNCAVGSKTVVREGRSAAAPTRVVVRRVAVGLASTPVRGGGIVDVGESAAVSETVVILRWCRLGVVEGSVIDACSVGTHVAGGVHGAEVVVGGHA